MRALVARVERHPIAFAFAIGILARLALVVLFHHGATLHGGIAEPFGDQLEYFGLASNLLAGKGYVLFEHGYGAPGPYIYRPPGYPIVLAGAYTLTGHHFGLVRALQTLATAAFVPIVMLGLRAIAARPRTVLVGGLVAAVNPFLIYFALTLTSDWLFDILFTAGAVLFIVALATGRRRAAIVAGLVLSMAALTRGEAWFYAWTMLAIALVVGRRAILTTIAWVLCGFLPLILAWSVRNWIVFHAFIPTQRGAMALSIIDSHAVDYSHYAWPGYEAWRSSLREHASMLPEVEREPYLLAEAKHFYREHPLDFAASCLHKAELFYALTPQASYEQDGGTRATPYQGRFYTYTSLLGYAAFLPFFFVGVVALLRRNALLVLPLLGAIAVNGAIGVLANPNIRIRSEMQGLLVIVACVGLERVVAMVRTRRAS